MYGKKLKNTFVKELKNSETRNLQKHVFLLKSHESLHMCSPIPFYRETKELLHSDIALRSK
jgi:hypothetical protein